MTYVKLFSVAAILLVAAEAQPRDCPTWLSQSGIANDVGLLSDAVSWEGADAETIDGVCGTYSLLHEANGIYDTRMRIYQSTDTGDNYIVFRPTQQTQEGGAIHADRRIAPCGFFEGCQGGVHDRFQSAFLDLIETVDDWETYLTPQVYVLGHSLGGALGLFMALYLYNVHGVAPSLSLGLAGPFIGDQRFADVYYAPFRNATSDTWWQVETVDVNNRSNFDGTVESYQVGGGWFSPPQLSIYFEAVCRFPIRPLPSSQSYGMHDLKNYRLYLQGTDCSI